MGTTIQDVYDSFFIKTPSVDFTGKDSLMFQIFKSSLPHCSKTVPEDLSYTFDTISWEGEFNNILGQDTIELIALCMKREYYRREVDKYTSQKQYIGTQAFNKLPNVKELADMAKSTFKDMNNEIEDFKQEFYSYTN